MTCEPLLLPLSTEYGIVCAHPGEPTERSSRRCTKLGHGGTEVQNSHPAGPDEGQKPRSYGEQQRHRDDQKLKGEKGMKLESGLRSGGAVSAGRRWLVESSFGAGRRKETMHSTWDTDSEYKKLDSRTGRGVVEEEEERSLNGQGRKKSRESAGWSTVPGIPPPMDHNP
ncbi:hypothetical protein TESG_00128 [Trichophyton tonsurans CBS 112818]|uniref:Uncharacterized protein n=1 Tax=Trichophyton tonsurans (strain CBS 112818) TaxID=647933 RepID=F2RMK6_TRIT1|nr:hypothetical protein TESG_00128 [Trichophyton tonsurans CBS 112818]